MFPLFFWLPASYHTPPVAVTAIFAAMLTKVGVYALIRVFILIFLQDVGYTHGLLLWIAVLTMITGVLGAAVQDDVRRLEISEDRRILYVHAMFIRDPAKERQALKDTFERRVLEALR